MTSLRCAGRARRPAGAGGLRAVGGAGVRGRTLLVEGDSRGAFAPDGAWLGAQREPNPPSPDRAPRACRPRRAAGLPRAGGRPAGRGVAGVRVGRPAGPPPLGAYSAGSAVLVASVMPPADEVARSAAAAASYSWMDCLPTPALLPPPPPLPPPPADQIGRAHV